MTHCPQWPLPHTKTSSESAAQKSEGYLTLMPSATRIFCETRRNSTKIEFCKD